MTLVQYMTVILALVGITITLLPLIPAGAPLIRVWDFPRAQIIVLLAIAFAALALAFDDWGAGVLLLAAALLGCLAWQIAAIWPYTHLARVEVAPADGADAHDDSLAISLLASNVLVSNRDVHSLRRVIEAGRPDIVLLVETDDWWHEHLAFLRDAYPHTLACPLDNSYGMHLFSRFELADAEVRYLVGDGIPSFKARVRACIDFMLYCVHPPPPPMVHTEERDAELLLVGKEVRRANVPTIVAGDLNDVAWSRSTRLFQEVSGLLDPRKGRGMFNTFSAKLPFVLRWPLDHVFCSEHFHLIDIAVLDDVGSDHLPFFIQLTCLGRASGDKPTPDAQGMREAEQTIAEGTRQGSSN